MEVCGTFELSAALLKSLGFGYSGRGRLGWGLGLGLMVLPACGDLVLLFFPVSRIFSFPRFPILLFPFCRRHVSFCPCFPFMEFMEFMAAAAPDVNEYHEFPGLSRGKKGERMGKEGRGRKEREGRREGRTWRPPRPRSAIALFLHEQALPAPAIYNGLVID